MASAPGALQVVSAQRLLELLTDAKKDAAFRDALIASPAATLESHGLRPTPTLVKFFRGLTAQSFAGEVEKAAQAMSHPLIQGEASIGNVAEAGI